MQSVDFSAGGWVDLMHGALLKLTAGWNEVARPLVRKHGPASPMLRSLLQAGCFRSSARIVASFSLGNGQECSALRKGFDLR